jgi:2,3-dihydro-2,3-dihydroxybenzoate dehydrogenase
MSSVTPHPPSALAQAAETWFVTGGARGIGEAVAKRAARAGAWVAVVDRDIEGARAVARAIVEAGGRALAAAVDVTDAHAIDAAMETVERTLGPLDVLVNVAGVLFTGPVIECEESAWLATFAVNTTGVFLTSRAAARRMVPRRRGSIITVASNSASVPRCNMAAYAASKAAAAHFTVALGLELAGVGIRCNVVNPGSTDTAMLRALSGESYDQERVVQGDPEAFRVGIPLGRVAHATDIADAVVFLASDCARHITMHQLCVDGGASLGA